LNTTLEKVEEANNHIMQSIRYAKLIQHSLLPNLAQVKTWLPESFFLWEPRDIIGGDFFYTDRFEDGSYIVSVADCTGHGVPGAFMTMIAATGLRRVIRDEGCRSPAAILKRLNRIVKSSLQQDTAHAHSDDGLDAAICFVDTRRNVVTFAGAKLPLIYTHEGECRVIKGNKQSLGYTSSDLNFDFSEHRVPLGDGTCFYLASDGFCDQLGGENRRRFSQRRFHELLLEHCQRPFEFQRQILYETLNAYRGENERQDDVTVVGFKPDSG
jgi:serine phosphatase RsbU (regulator of sigma subunit)